MTADRSEWAVRQTAVGVEAPAGGPAERDSSGPELLAKVNAVLTVLEERAEAGAGEIAEAIDEPLSSVYRLLQSLLKVGLVDRGWGRGSYRLGVLMLTVSGQLEDRLDIRQAALPSLRTLWRTTGATSFLCVLRDARAVCIERIEGRAVRSLAMQLGGSLPLYAGAAPRALLAFLPSHEQRRVLRVSRQPEDPARPPTASILADLERVRADGVAVSDEDVTAGIAALGAPVFNHRGELEAAISVSGLRESILGANRQANTDLIRACAYDVSRALGLEAQS